MQTMPGSPVSDGGRGLKPHMRNQCSIRAAFARQRWRAWIETCQLVLIDHSTRFARQRWRAWIETARRQWPQCLALFARQRWRAWIETPPPQVAA